MESVPSVHIWIWCYNGSSFRNIAKELVICVYEDIRGNIWTTSPEGILTHYENESLIEQETTAIKVFEGAGPFLGISEDKEGNIWIGGGAGAWRYDGITLNYYTGVTHAD